jgi:gamma-glutamyltranspeptidase/glutathione hydrolase
MPAAVATGHPQTSQVALDLLRAGGNAFDAAVGAGFAASVTEPMFTSLGGGGFLLARHRQGEARVFDFFVDTPGRGLAQGALEPHFLPVTVHFLASDQVFNIGLGSVAVPGTLAGLLHVQRRLGRLPLHRVVAPAARLAREGVALSDHQAYALALLRPIHRLTPAGRALYTPDGRDRQPGEQVANPELADFLESLDDDPEAFYRGAPARAVARDMREGGGLLTEEDLAAYRVRERKPLAFDYRGHRVLTNPPPSFGGSLIALSLSLHEGAPPEAAEDLCWSAAVMREVDRLRDEGVLSPDALDPDAADQARDRIRRASGGTTHLSVVDADGSAASMTLSNGEGSGYVVPGTGVMLNNMLGEDDLHPDGFHAAAPGQRVASMMSPSLVLRGSRLRLVLGSGGSKRIRTALVQVIRGVVDRGLSLTDAVEAPRLHWDGSAVQVEPGFAAGPLAALRGRWPVNEWAERSLYFGGVHAVDASGHAVGDPRRGGHGACLSGPESSDTD